MHSLDPTDRHTWPAVTTSLKECRVPLLRYKPNVPNAACLCKKPGALPGQRMLFRCWFCCLPAATDGRTEKWVRVTALDRALNMDDGRPMRAVHPEACMRMHWAPWVPAPPSILWDEEDLDLKQSLEAHCQTLQTTDQKNGQVQVSRLPGNSVRSHSYSRCAVGDLFHTEHLCLPCQSLDQCEGKSDRSLG